VILRQSLPGEPSAEVSRLFVVPAARRQGVASALLKPEFGHFLSA
jgi:GNAT superfamily N-acetyltransferase